jgi:hypothetical protein
MYSYNKSSDILSLFITSIYEISIHKTLHKYDFDNFIKFTNFISKSNYYKSTFQTSKDIKNFFHTAKKYSNIVNNHCYDSNEFTPLKLFDYIRNNLKYNLSYSSKKKFNSYMNKSNPSQVFEYTLSKTENEQIQSFLNVFDSIYKINFSEIKNVFNIYYIQNLENNLNSVKNDMIFFYKEQKLNFNYDDNQIMTYLKKKIDKHKLNYIKLDTNVIIDNYDENIFLFPDKIKEIIDMNIPLINCEYIELKNIIQYVLFNNGIFKLNNNDKIYYNKIPLLNISNDIIINNNSNINTVKNIGKIIFKKNKKISLIRKENV